LAAGASVGDAALDSVALGPSAAGTRGATSAALASAGRQLAPAWPRLAARTWHSRLQNHASRHRPQRSRRPSLLSHARQELMEVGAMVFS